ncbi:DgyrCDS3630 [Dimorphilus gyrociliatus]|uniref:DgyrCDS3630 n=1 Tax=Dimorphilus gyrociliatus TaxID=2664684 RepID=A0A7I8VEA2_9ANNE|nr:DgyrCDS3630 [Dimorphilus gyrociliatus]
MSDETINELSIKLLELFVEEGNGKLDRTIGPKYFRKYREIIPNKFLCEKGYVTVEDFVIRELSQTLSLRERDSVIEYHTSLETKKDIFRRKVLQNKSGCDLKDPTANIECTYSKSDFSYESSPVPSNVPVVEPIEELTYKGEKNPVAIKDTIELQNLYNEFTEKVPFRFLTKRSISTQKKVKEWKHAFDIFACTKWIEEKKETEKILYKVNPLTPPIEPGKLKFDSVDVAISAVYSVDSFYVQIMNEDDCRLELEEKVKNYKSLPTVIQKNTSCLASLQNLWFRANIETVFVDTKTVTVFFVDWGNRATLSWSEVRYLPPELASTPGYAYHCSLMPLPYVSTAHQKLRDLETCVTLKQIAPFDGNAIIVNLEIDGKDFTKSILNQTMPTLSIPDSCIRFQLIVTYLVSPKCFFAKLSDQTSELAKIQVDLKSLFQHVATQVHLGENVAIKLSSDGQDYCLRGRVVSTEDNCIKVRYLDLGDYENVNLSDVRKLPSEIDKKVPYEAVLLSLVDLNVDWACTTIVSRFVRRLIQSQVLTAVRCITSDSKELLVDLFTEDNRRVTDIVMDYLPKLFHGDAVLPDKVLRFHVYVVKVDKDNVWILLKDENTEYLFSALKYCSNDPELKRVKYVNLGSTVLTMDKSNYIRGIVEEIYGDRLVIRNIDSNDIVHVPIKLVFELPKYLSCVPKLIIKTKCRLSRFVWSEKTAEKLHKFLKIKGNRFQASINSKKNEIGLFLNGREISQIWAADEEE